MTVKASRGPVRAPRTKVISLGAAAMIMFMLLAQLYSYEDFYAVLGSVLPSYDQFALQVAGMTVVVTELFSLPYLLGMYVSPLMRLTSAVFAGLTSGFWLVIALTNAHAANSALFSTTLELSGGIGPALWSILLVALVVSVIAADSKFRHDTAS